MLGPNLFRLDRPSDVGSTGPTESSLSLSSSLASLRIALGEIFVDFTGDRGGCLAIEALALSVCGVGSD